VAKTTLNGRKYATGHTTMKLVMTQLCWVLKTKMTINHECKSLSKNDAKTWTMRCQSTFCQSATHWHWPWTWPLFWPKLLHLVTNQQWKAGWVHGISFSLFVSCDKAHVENHCGCIWPTCQV